LLHICRKRGGVYVGIDNEANRHVCDMNSEVSECCSVQSEHLSTDLGSEAAEFLYDTFTHHSLSASFVFSWIIYSTRWNTVSALPRIVESKMFQFVCGRQAHFPGPERHNLCCVTTILVALHSPTAGCHADSHAVSRT
jgi:hypothetical protein